MLTVRLQTFVYTACDRWYASVIFIQNLLEDYCLWSFSSLCTELRKWKVLYSYRHLGRTKVRLTSGSPRYDQLLHQDQNKKKSNCSESKTGPLPRLTQTSPGPRPGKSWSWSSCCPIRLSQNRMKKSAVLWVSYVPFFLWSVRCLPTFRKSLCLIESSM